MFSFLDAEESEKYWMLYELQWCDHRYVIDEVMLCLEKVNSRELDSYEFGYDATLIEYESGQSTIHYDYGEHKIEIDSNALYQFIRSWVNYLSSLIDQDCRPS